MRKAQLAVSLYEFAQTATISESADDRPSSHGIPISQHITALRTDRHKHFRHSISRNGVALAIVDRHELAGETRDIGIKTMLPCQSKPRFTFQYPIKPILTALIAAKTAIPYQIRSSVIFVKISASHAVMKKQARRTCFDGDYRYPDGQLSAKRVFGCFMVQHGLSFNLGHPGGIWVLRHAVMNRYFHVASGIRLISRPNGLASGGSPPSPPSPSCQ